MPSNLSVRLPNGRIAEAHGQECDPPIVIENEDIIASSTLLEVDRELGETEEQASERIEEESSNELEARLRQAEVNSLEAEEHSPAEARLRATLVVTAPTIFKAGQRVEILDHVDLPSYNRERLIGKRWTLTPSNAMAFNDGARIYKFNSRIEPSVLKIVGTCKCSTCKKKIVGEIKHNYGPTEAGTYRNRYFCEECFKLKFFSCCVCDKSFPVSSRQIDKNKGYCSHCFKERFKIFVEKMPKIDRKDVFDMVKDLDIDTNLMFTNITVESASLRLTGNEKDFFVPDIISNVGRIEQPFYIYGLREGGPNSFIVSNLPESCMLDVKNLIAKTLDIGIDEISMGMGASTIMHGKVGISHKIRNEYSYVLHSLLREISSLIYNYSFMNKVIQNQKSSKELREELTKINMMEETICVD